MILGVILLSYFMILLDNSIIFTGLPQIRASFGFSASGLAWVSDAYTLVFGGLLLLGARAGDLLGRRRVFVFGLAVFSLASLLVGVAPTGWFAIAARAIQGVGAAIVAPSSLSLLTASFPAGTERVKAIGLYGATAGIGASLGLVLGGALAAGISWRVGFFINVPIGAAMIALAPRFLPETPRTPGRFDAFGAAAATLGVGALVFGIIRAADAGWGATETVGSMAVGAILLVALVSGEHRAEQPIMPLRLFASHERVTGYLTRMLYMAAMMGFFFFTSQYLQGVLGFSALAAGVGFLPMTVVNFVVALAVPRVTARLGQNMPLAAGLALTATGMFWLAQVSVGSSYWTAVAAPMVLIGTGQGLVFAPVTSQGLAGVGAADAGAASGLVNSFHQIGSAVGLGVLVTVSAHAGSGLAMAAAVLSAQVHVALEVAAVILAVGLVVVLILVTCDLLRRPNDQQRITPVGEPSQLDGAYRAKYGQWSGPVAGITSDVARATTLRVDPAHESTSAQGDQATE